MDLRSLSPTFFLPPPSVGPLFLKELFIDDQTIFPSGSNDQWSYRFWPAFNAFTGARDIFSHSVFLSDCFFYLFLIRQSDRTPRALRASPPFFPQNIFVDGLFVSPPFGMTFSPWCFFFLKYGTFHGPLFSDDSFLRSKFHPPSMPLLQGCNTLAVAFSFFSFPKRFSRGFFFCSFFLAAPFSPCYLFASAFVAKSTRGLRPSLCCWIFLSFPRRPRETQVSLPPPFVPQLPSPPTSSRLTESSNQLRGDVCLSP